MIPLVYIELKIELEVGQSHVSLKLLHDIGKI